MPLIIDPDNLNQGSSTSVPNLVFESTGSGGNTTITSATSAMPALAANVYFEIRNHSVAGNNGLYQVLTVNSSTASYEVVKQNGDDPIDAVAEAATMLGATGAGTSKSVYFDTGFKKIWLFEQGNLSSDGVTLQALYSFIKEEWKADSTLIPYAFPITAITPEQFELTSGWQFVNDATRKLIRTGGWKEYDVNDDVTEEWTGIITLGTFEDSVNDRAYYQVGTDPTDTSAAINFTYNGPVNEPIKVFASTIGPAASLNFNANNQLTRGTGSWITDGYKVGAKVTIRDAENVGNNGDFVLTVVTTSVLTVSGTPFTTNADDDAAVVGYNYKSAIKLFLRMRDADPNGKTYAQSKLSDIGVTTGVDNKVFRFPLSNATDLKVEETDANIGSNSPYTQIKVRYFDQAYNRDVDTTTNRNFGIVIDVGTHSGVDGSVAGGGTLTSTEGGIPTDGTYDGGTLTVHEDGANAGTYTIGTIVSATAVPITTTFPGSQSDLSFTLQRATPVVATAEEIYEKVQYQLRQASDIDSTDRTVTGKTADALLTFVGDTLKCGVSIPTNPNGGGSGVIIEGFRLDDTNRLVFVDNIATDRSYPFVASGSINFNSNLVSDGDGYYWMFFQYTERFTNIGFSIGSVSGSGATITSTTTNLTTELADGDYIALSGFSNSVNNGIWRLTGTPAGGGPYTVTATKVDGATVIAEGAGPSVSLDKHPINSPDALIVQDNDDVDIKGAISGATVAFTFDYEGNIQGGRTAGDDAVVVLRAIGLDTAQFVETTGTLTRATGLSFSVVSGLERNYANA